MLSAETHSGDALEETVQGKASHLVTEQVVILDETRDYVIDNKTDLGLLFLSVNALSILCSLVPVTGALESNRRHHIGGCRTHLFGSEEEDFQQKK